jgi:malate dehydrogenase
MITVAVVGAGEVGGATAHALAASDSVGRILLIDPSAKVAAGKALDIQQSGAVAGFHTRLAGTDDITRVIGCSVCVIADRFGDDSSGMAGDEGLAMLGRLLPLLSGAPLVFAGSRQEDLLHRASLELHVNRVRLIGSAPEAYRSAVRAMIGLEAGCSPSEVNVAVLGRPPGGLVVPWSDVSISGFAVAHRLEPIQVTRLEAMVDRLWPPGPYALGLAAAVVAEAVTTSSRRTWSVLTALAGEFGVKEGVGVIPVSLAPRGIAAVSTPELTGRERVKVQTALSAPAAAGGRR